MATREDEHPLVGDGPRTERVGLVLALTGIAALGPLLFGFCVGFTSPIIVQLTDDLQLTTGEVSFFSALVTIGAMVGALVGGPFSNRFGRGRAIGFGSLPLIIGFILIGFAKEIYMLDVGRFLTGIGVGVVSVCVPVYIAEIAPDRLRGALGATNQLSITAGILVAFGIGMAVPWRTLAFIFAGSAGLLLILHFLLPNTPRWLVARGRLQDAKNALRLLRGPHADIDREVIQLEEAARTVSDVKLREVFAPDMRRPLFVGIAMMIFQQFSGVNAVSFYTSAIFADAGSDNANANSLIYGAVQVGVTFLSVLLIDKMGRRPLLVLAFAGMVIAAVLLGTFFYLKEHGQMFGFLALFSLILYVVGFSIGVGAIPWVIMGEIFPTRVRGVAASIATTINWLGAFVVTETFASMKTAFTEAGTFYFYGAICLLGIAFVLKLVPETKGKSFEDIAEEFGGGRRVVEEKKLDLA